VIVPKNLPPALLAHHEQRPQQKPSHVRPPSHTPLLAAHSERAQVNTSQLLGPLKDAYDAVDRALAEAETSFRRYQDVRQVLSDFLGVQLPA